MRNLYSSILFYPPCCLERQINQILASLTSFTNLHHPRKHAVLLQWWVVPLSPDTFPVLRDTVG